MTPEAVQENIIPPVVQLCKDPIPNIRFNAAKTCEVIVKYLKEQKMIAPVEKLKPVLTEMSQNDTDVDVRYFAGHALASA